MNTEADFRDQLLSFADKYFGEYKVKKKPTGDEIIPALCPICHGGDRKDKETFALSIDKGCYVCKRGSCGRHGTFSELAKELSGQDISLPGRKKNVKKKQTFVVPETVLSPPTEQIYQYFSLRGISKETVDAFKIASDPNGMIVFQFFENGTNVYEKYRRPWKPSPEEAKKKEWCLSGTKPVLFNMDNVSFSRPVIITEGQIDAMALYEAGLTNVVSVPSGCDDVRWVEFCWDWLQKVKTFVLFGDNDEPGRRMVQNLTKRLGAEKCLLVEDYPEIPDNPGKFCKDANEILLRFGQFELISMVENASEIPVKGLINIGDIVPIDETTIPRIKTNIPSLDENIGGLAESCLTVITGESSGGKSTITGQFLLSAIEQGVTCCCYSGELSKEKFLRWITLQAAGSEWIGLKYDPVKGKNIPFVSQPVSKRIQEWMRDKLFLFDNNETFDSSIPDSIMTVFTHAAQKYGCKLFVVD